MTRFPQWISPRISLPVANLGEIPGKIAPIFLPPWICFSARNLASFAVGFRRDFSCRDYCFPARILVSFAAGSRQNFGRRDFSSRREPWRDLRQDPGEILAAGIFASRRESWRDSKNDPGEILAAGIPARFPPGRKIPAAKISPGSWRDSRQDFSGIPPRSWSLFYQGRD